MPTKSLGCFMLVAHLDWEEEYHLGGTERVPEFVRRGREPRLPALRALELAKCVAVVAEKSPVVAEDQHAHGIEPDRAIAGVEVLC